MQTTRNDLNLMESPISAKSPWIAHPPPKSSLIRGVLVRLFLPILAITLIILLNAFLKTYFQIDYLSQEGLVKLRNQLHSFGAFTPLAFIFLYSLRSVFYIPEPVLMMTAGFLAGTVYGMLMVVFGSLVAASLAYGIALFLAKWSSGAFFQKFLKRKLGPVVQFANRFGLRMLFIWRMMPIFPFTMCTYSSGFLKISFPRYILAMGIGVLSPAFLYCSLGSTFLEVPSWSGILKSWQFLAFLAMVLMMCVFLRRQFSTDPK
jgi:uncharacterized membrane protein YdjX (TVP38/TMEM64 family)